MNTDKRKPDESFPEYKARMQTQRKIDRIHLRGKLAPMPEKSLKTRRKVIEKKLREMGAK